MRDLIKNEIYYLVFETAEERELYIKTERSNTFRAHRSKLDELSRAYIAKLQDDPSRGDDHHNEYMSAVKKEHENFAGNISRIANNENYLILESDLSPAPAL
jgi:hypothetical protein